MRRRTIAFLVLGTLAFFGQTPDAHADGDGRSIVIVVEANRDSEAIASMMGAHVASTSHVSDPHAFQVALATRGTRGFGQALVSPARDAQLVARARAAATQTHVDTAILVSVRKGRRGAHLHVWLVDAQGHGPQVDQDVPTGASASEESDAAWGAVAALFPAPAPAPAPAVASTPPAPANTQPLAVPSASETLPRPAEAVVAPPDADHPVESPRSVHGTYPRASALVIVQAAMQAGSRHFAYTDRLTPTLRPYDLSLAPRASIEAEVYPLARSGVPFAKGLGVTGDYARAFALGSDAGGTSVGTHWQSFDVGLRERIALGSAVLVGLNVGYGGIDFTFDAPPFTAVLPSAVYRFVRLGADVRVKLGAFSIFGGGSYLSMLSTGDMGEVFPREKVGGLEASLGAALLFARRFELSLGLGYSRFFYSMNPVPGDANVAGGAVDQMGQLSLGLSYLL